MDRLARCRDRRQGSHPGPVPRLEAPRARPGAAGRLPGRGVDALRQHDPARRAGLVPRRRRARAPHPGLHPLERGGDGGQRQPPGRRHRRPPLDLRLARPRSTRSASTTSSAARTTGSPATTSTSRATPRRASTPAPSSRGGSTRSSSTTSGASSRPATAGAVDLPPPVADARLLGVPDRVDGPRPDQRDLPGPLQPLPAEPPARRHDRRRGSGASSATASATSPRPSARSRWPRASGSTT